jgi:chemotaxis protein histidine kinase CheA
MKTNFVLSGMLVIILFSAIFGLFVVNDVFAQNLYVSSNDSEAYKKQKELEAKKAEQQAKAEEKQKELEAKKAEQQAKAEEKQKELEAKKAELEINRENLELKQLKKLKEYEEKLKEIKEKSQHKIEKNISNNNENLPQKSKKLEEKTIKTSEEIQKKLAAKFDKLDLRTKNILDKINNGQYMGKKIASSIDAEKYELSFDLVDAFLINDKSQTSSLTGKMSFSTYDKSKSDLKLELDECEITTDEIVYNCGFGKARTVSFGPSGAKDSLVIIAFLEDDVLEVHTTLKIFLTADIPINKIEQSQVSIVGPQSKLSNTWFLNGTATLSKIVSTSEQTTTRTNSTITLEDGIPIDEK